MIFLMQTATRDDEEFNLFLFAILVLGIIFICISVLIAVLIALLSLLIIFGFIAVGALSTSVLVGINKKSFTAGFRTFTIIFSTFSFGVIGTGAFWFFNRIVHWWSQSEAIIIGLSVGLASGFIAGISVAFLIKKLSTLLKNKLEKKAASADSNWQDR
jgi:Flp pilus assembly protein protease CpaA